MKHNVMFKVINCDDNEVTYTYKNINEFMNEWFNENDSNIPMLDDRLIYAEVNGMAFYGKTVLDAMNAIKYCYGLKY